MPNPTEQRRTIKGAARDSGVSTNRVSSDIGALSHRGHVRESNEDAYVVFRLGRYVERVASNIPEAELPSRFDETGHVMIVADGLGGHDAGDVASSSALVQTFQFILRSPKWVLKLDDPATRKAEILEVLARSKDYIASIHAALREQAAGDPRLAGMGTTLTTAYSVGVDLFVIHVGDSKAYLFREGEMHKITRDHTVAQEFADMGTISQEEVASHRMQHVLTRAVGGPDKELLGDTHHLQIAHGDRLLLCSDGLTDMASEADVAAVLGEHPSSQDACQALVDMALRRGGTDNVTVIVARYTVA